MTPFLRKLLGLNWLLLVNMLALAIFGDRGLQRDLHAGQRRGGVLAETSELGRGGFRAFMITSLIDYRWIKWGALPMYLAGLIFLILTRFIGTKVYGARSWLHLGPINFQPSQLAIIAGILVLALFLSQFSECIRCFGCSLRRDRRRRCLLIMMQPDLGMTMVWVPVLMALLFVGGIPRVT